ncbi:MAG TPA: hypothetical protein VLL52_00070 [Anaerolineae bacterium]|nr:hypothetical protein [Anaerolineae bacterium]
MKFFHMRLVYILIILILFLSSCQTEINNDAVIETPYQPTEIITEINSIGATSVSVSATPPASLSVSATQTITEESIVYPSLIAFSSTRSGNSEVYTIFSDGSQLVKPEYINSFETTNPII